MRASARQNSLQQLHQRAGRGDIRAVARIKLIEPPAFGSGARGKLTERAVVGVAHALNVAARQRQFGAQTNGLLEAPDRLRHAEFCHPRRIIIGRVGRDRIWRDAPAVAALDAIQHSLPLPAAAGSR